MRVVNALTTNSDQICFAATRVYAQAEIYDTFFARYVEALKVKNNVIGDPYQEGVEIGPVVDKAHYDRIMNIISSAKNNKESSLIHGGSALEDKVHSIPCIATMKLTLR